MKYIDSYKLFESVDEIKSTIEDISDDMSCIILLKKAKQYEINNDKFYKYSRSTKNMYDEPFIYLNIDVNNNDADIIPK